MAEEIKPGGGDGLQMKRTMSKSVDADEIIPRYLQRDL